MPASPVHFQSASVSAWAGLAAGHLAGPLHRRRVHRSGAVLAGEQPSCGLVGLPILAKDAEQHRREHDVAVLLPLALLHVDRHALAVDVLHLEVDHFRQAQSRGVDGHQQGSGLDSLDGSKKLAHFLTTQDDWKSFRIFGADDLFPRPILAEADTVEEMQGAADLVVQTPRRSAPNEMEKVLARLPPIQLPRRAKPANLTDGRQRFDTALKK